MVLRVLAFLFAFVYLWAAWIALDLTPRATMPEIALLLMCVFSITGFTLVLLALSR